MKNLLIATTALVATAGVAAADVSLSGAANFGVINNGDTGADTFMYNNVSVTAAMSGETDGGLTFGASLSMRSGNDVDLDTGDLNARQTLTDLTVVAKNRAGKNLSDMSLGNIYVSGDWGKLTFDANGIDNLMDDGFAHDVSYSGTFGALVVSATANVDGGAQAANGGDFSVKAVYSANGLTATVIADDSSDFDVTGAYALNDMVTVSLNYDTDGQSATESETIAKVAYSNAGVTAHLAFADDKDDAWELGLGYAANGMSIAAVFAEDGEGTKTESDITASYDLGGGMSLNAATNESGAFFVGSKMTF
ncbi:porin [Ascidiaceihabitans sp.]|nr:porin [Ascidiaceihabitans sp.]